ncbi:MAG: D-alanine--D-alanine ligase [Anaerolineaceae bacterium]|nr:D-alanine--D-alanine ligase [Anaerolineaceae bacterium]
MKIAVLANLKKNAPTWEGIAEDHWDDLDSPKTIEAIMNALRANGHTAEFFEAQITPPYSLIEKLTDYAPDLCFNIAESHYGESREAQIPAVLDALRMPYTGSQVLNLTLSLDKPMTKRILHYHNLPTPEFQVFEKADDPIDSDLLDEAGELRFPLFVKPSREGTSIGVDARSIVHTVAELYDVVAEQLQRYRQPILVEHFIEGRELTVGVVGNLGRTAARRLNDREALDELPATMTFLPVLEIDLEAYDDSEAGIYTNRMKTDLVDEFYYHCPALIDNALVQQLNLLAAAVFRVTGCRDVARVDFRLDKTTGSPYILEVNPLPGLNPDYSDLCIQANAAGWTYEQLIGAITDQALGRYSLLTETVTNPGTAIG